MDPFTILSPLSQVYCVIYPYIGRIKETLDIRQDALYINFLNYMKYNCLENEEEEVDEQVQKMC